MHAPMPSLTVLYFLLLFLEPVKQNDSWQVWPIADLISGINIYKSLKQEWLLAF